MTKNSLTRLRNSLSGERGLVLAIIALAHYDMLYGEQEERQAARRYFAGETYQHHLELLDLPAELRPCNSSILQ